MSDAPAPQPKRPSDSTNTDPSTPAKRPRTEGGDTDSPSTRGGRGGRGGGRGRGERGGRGGRGGGGRGGNGMSRGGGPDRRTKAGRGGADNRAWGGRSTNAKDGKMRNWGDAKEGEGGGEGEGGDKQARLPKKKVAILCGYNGTGYKGSQINPGIDTIEGEVFKALIAADAISPDNADSHQKIGLTRAARTDAGVSAAINVLACKVILKPATMAEGTSLEAHINSFLPPAIRIWSIRRAQGSFNPRGMCDQRQYEYTLPTHVFLGPKPGSNMYERLKGLRSPAAATATAAVAAEEAVAEPAAEAALGPADASVEAAPEATPAAPEAADTAADVDTAAVDATSTPADATPAATPAAAPAAAPALTPAPASVAAPTETAAQAATDAFWSARAPTDSFADDLAAKRAWRLPQDVLEAARRFVKAYEGSFNYHNFTVGKDFRDRSCQRTMRKLEVTEPFIVGGTEYVSIRFLGQSFMLHQIRKMVGLAILAIRTSTPAALIPETFGPSRIHVPKAPALGLLLLEPQYVEYNKKVEEGNIKVDILRKEGKMTDEECENQTRETITGEGVQDRVDQFKQVEVYERMWEIEQREDTYSLWLNYLDVYQGPDFEYLNPKGIIPAKATFKKGEDPDRIRHNAGAEVPAPWVDEEVDLPGAAEEEG